MTQLQLGPQCCCPACPTKEEAGLPDSLRVTFTVVTSGDEGMPSDIVFGYCDDPGTSKPTKMTFEESSLLVDMLDQMIFDYVGPATLSDEPCGTCCYVYESRNDYTSPCLPGPQGTLLGVAPFLPRFFGATSYRQFWTTNLNTETPGYPFDPPEGGCNEDEDICCDQNVSGCEDCGTIHGWTDGTQYTPLKVFASAKLIVCIQGNVVTVCAFIDISIECETTEGGAYNFVAYTRIGIFNTPPGDQCEDNNDSPTSFDVVDTTTSCGSFSTSELELIATGDLSAVSGSTIWDKMKSAPSDKFVSEYESLHCNCGSPECSGEHTEIECKCDLDFCTCCANQACIPDSEITTEENPVNRDCKYSVGTMRMTFQDE